MDTIKKRMKNYPNVDFKFGEIDKVAIPDNSYDVIVIHYVMHDIEANLRENILRELRGKLKNGVKSISESQLQIIMECLQLKLKN